MTDLDPKALGAVAQAIRQCGHYATYTKMAEAAIRAYLAALWQPMSTAPRDGTSILALYDLNDGRYMPVIVWYDTDGGLNDDDAGAAVYPWDSHYNSYPKDRLDYWAPIPHFDGEIV